MPDQFVHPIGRFNLLEGIYFHLTDATGSLVLHNARIDKGLVRSASFSAQVPGLAGITTQYAVCNAQQEKEAVWEQIRASEFPKKPSRLKSFYCFDNIDDAKIAQTEWFSSAGRIIVELRILEGSNVARMDSKWLNCAEERWAENARAYWSGEVTSQPYFETIVSGCLYLPGWESFPLLFEI